MSAIENYKTLKVFKW